MSHAAGFLNHASSGHDTSIMREPVDNGCFRIPNEHDVYTMNEQVSNH